MSASFDLEKEDLDEPKKNSGQGITVTVKKPKAQKSEALWMSTFADLSFILMAFFALLLSMSTLDKVKTDAITESIEKPKIEPNRNLSTLLIQIQKEIKKRKLENYVAAKLDVDGLAVEFNSNVLFSSGSSTINPSFDRISGEIIEILAKAPKRYHLSIEGHTDDVGSQAGNWDLSAKRGISMLYKFKGKGVALEQMKVVAFADSQPKVDIKGKSGAALKAARDSNRRVVIRLN